MTMLATVLTLASLACDPSVAPFFILPKPAVTDGPLRKEAIYQMDNYTNSIWRLDGHVMSAIYGTTEALLERLMFPQMMNYGGARFAPASKLATADFGDDVPKDLYSTNWFSRRYQLQKYEPSIFPSNFVAGVDRDFSNRGPRIAWPIDLVNGFVYADKGEQASIHDLTQEWGRFPNWSIRSVDHPSISAAHYSSGWLVPKRFLRDDRGPSGTWCLNDPMATADWKGAHLLLLSEIDFGDLFP